MDQPLVSIIIPVYNRTDPVKKSIQSILDQTYKNWEIIIVDDGSSIPFKHSFLTPEQKIFVLRHNKNKGAAAARNTGMKKAKGEYIAFLDSDDIWLPEKLEKQVEIFNKHTGIDASITGYNYVFPNGTKRKKIIPIYNIYHQSLIGDHLSMGSTLVFRKKCLEKVGFQSEDLERLEDWEWQIKFSQHYNIESIPEILAEIFQGKHALFDSVKKSIEILEKRENFITEKRDRKLFIFRCLYELSLSAYYNKKYILLLFYLLNIFLRNPKYFFQILKKYRGG